MTDTEARVQEALRRLGREPTPLASAEVEAARAEAARRTIEAAIVCGARARRRQRRARIGGVVVAAAAAVGAVWWGAAPWLAECAFAPGAGERSVEEGRGTASRGAGSAILLIRGQARALGTNVEQRGASTFAPGDRVQAEVGGARLALGKMTEVQLEAQAVLALAEVESDAQRLVLSNGRASFEVDPRRKGRVVVETPDVRIAVVGTYFHVALERQGAETWTSVRVERGRVEIRRGGHAVLLHPGESWTSRVDSHEASENSARAHPTSATSPELSEAFVPAGGETSASHPPREKGAPSASTAANAATETNASVRLPRAGAGVEERARESTSAESVETTPTTLGEEIHLYRSALSARNRGDDARAVERLSTFLAKYPASNLRQEATVEHFRALRRLGRSSEAARAATRYLSTYPAGFARSEASELALPRP